MMKMTDADSDISQRKADHIDIVLHKDVGFDRLTTGFERIRFVHAALPELCLSDIDLKTKFLGKLLSAPFLISSMTGGPAHAARINAHLAEAANELGIAFAIGSQRIALENQGAAGMNKELRRIAPNIPLIGNLGAAQIIGRDGLSLARRAIDMIEADAIFIHLNPLQEAIQPEGDTDWRGVIDAIAALVEDDIPIAVKEVGFGLSADVIKSLQSVGVTIIDVAGAGGTNWARVEGHRDDNRHKLASAFTEWGIPTADAIMTARSLSADMTLIGSGGIKDGVEAAKALRLGADIVGIAAGTLTKALESPEAVVEYFQQLIDLLRITCFVTGSRTLKALKTAKLQD